MAAKIVIVGAGLAGATAAATLREEAFDGDIVLIGAEPRAPYERPPLSKEYLRGEKPQNGLLVRPEGFYADNDIETRLGVSATGLRPGEQTVELADGQRVSYDKLLIATGGWNRRMAIPGLELEGVYDLRVVEDADRIRDEAQSGRAAVVAGMGLSARRWRPRCASLARRSPSSIWRRCRCSASSARTSVGSWRPSTGTAVCG